MHNVLLVISVFFWFSSDRREKNKIKVQEKNFSSIQKKQINYTWEERSNILYAKQITILIDTLLLRNSLVACRITTKLLAKPSCIDILLISTSFLRMLGYTQSSNPLSQTKTFNFPTLMFFSLSFFLSRMNHFYQIIPAHLSLLSPKNTSFSSGV